MAIVHNEDEFRACASDIKSGGQYVKCIRDIADTTGTSISPKTPRTDQDIEGFAAGLTARYAPKSINNYRSVMRRYVRMVEELGL